MRAFAVVAVGAMAIVALSGCFEPFRVKVDQDVLAQASGWVVTPAGTQGGFFGPKSKETRYAFDRDPDAAVPFAGSLQVFSIRGFGSLGTDELLDLAHDLVEQGAQDKKIQLTDGGASGTRSLVSKVGTHWFVREGRTTQSGDLFEQGVTVRILGEVGHDGRSDTSFLVIGMAQVSRTNQCPSPLPLNCQPIENDLQTWIQIVGDSEGTVEGATSSSGFVDHLVTR